MKCKILSLKNIIFLCFSFSLFFNSYFYMMWSTYYNGSLRKILVLFNYFAMFMLLIYSIVNRQQKLLSLKNVLIISGLFLAFIATSWFGSSYKVLVSIPYIMVLLSFINFCQLQNKEKAEIFEYVYKIFIILVLPSVFYFILTFILKLNLPGKILLSAHEGKSASGVYYEWRPLGLILKGGSDTLPRLCGVFDEPGVVGTLSGIFLPILILKNNKRDKIWTILLFIEGVLSMSMAFYALCVITLCCLAFRASAFKLAIFLLLLILGVVLFSKASFDNPAITALQSRIDLDSSTVIKDNRTSSNFDYVYSQLFEQGGRNLFWGFGPGAVSNNKAINASFSYKCLIYDYGLIGTFLYLSVFWEIAILKFGINKNNFPFLIVFFVSVYQRPYVLNFQYFTIFCLALASIECYFSNIYNVKYNNFSNFIKEKAIV